MPGPPMPLRRKCALSFALLLSISIGASAQKETAVPSRQSNAEQKTARALEVARANPLSLRAFLVAMPKGGDLHNHLSGAVYAESRIRAAVEDRVCIDRAKLSFSKPLPDGGSAPSCGEGNVPASDADKDQYL